MSLLVVTHLGARCHSFWARCHSSGARCHSLPPSRHSLSPFQEPKDSDEREDPGPEAAPQESQARSGGWMVGGLVVTCSCHLQSCSMSLIWG